MQGSGTAGSLPSKQCGFTLIGSAGPIARRMRVWCSRKPHICGLPTLRNTVWQRRGLSTVSEPFSEQAHQIRLTSVLCTLPQWGNSQGRTISE
jgi:hypothetical protein